jgi:4'-phosphopantetheinyl transferase
VTLVVAVRPLRSVRPNAVDEADPAMPAWRVREHLAGRALLRSLLHRHTGVGDDPIQIEPTGAPWLPHRRHVGISIAHSGWLVAAAVALGCRVGIDVQIPEPVDQALVRRCCLPRDTAVLTALSPAARDRELSRIWTVQEACVKATGQGLTGQPWTVPVPYRRLRGQWHGVRWVSWPTRWPAPVACAVRSLEET